MAIYDPTYRSEPDPRSWVLDILVQALEWSEEPVGVGHVEPGPVIPDEVYRVGFPEIGTDLDPRPRRLRGEFPRISEQVVEQDPKEPGVSLHRQPLLYPEDETALRLLGL